MWSNVHICMQRTDRDAHVGICGHHIVGEREKRDLRNSSRVDGWSEKEKEKRPGFQKAS